MSVAPNDRPGGCTPRPTSVLLSGHGLLSQPERAVPYGVRGDKQITLTAVRGS